MHLLSGKSLINIHSDDSLITMSVPLDSDVAGHSSLRNKITLSSAVGFEQFFSLVYDAMGLPSDQANLGYRFGWEPVRTEHRRFCTIDDFRVIVPQMIKKNRAARSVTPVLWIYNEVYCQSVNSPQSIDPLCFN